jgi:hypothetical protein
MHTVAKLDQHIYEPTINIVSVVICYIVRLLLIVLYHYKPNISLRERHSNISFAQCVLHIASIVRCHMSVSVYLYKDCLAYSTIVVTIFQAQRAKHSEIVVFKPTFTVVSRAYISGKQKLSRHSWRNIRHQLIRDL